MVKQHGFFDLLLSQPTSAAYSTSQSLWLPVVG
jgi:hypothetical protein